MRKTCKNSLKFCEKQIKYDVDNIIGKYTTH